MPKVGVIGSEYFMDYTRQIQSSCIFPQVELFTFPDTKNSQPMDSAEVISSLEHDGIQALVLGPQDYEKLSHAGIQIPCYIVRPSIQDFLVLHNNIGDYTTTAVILSSYYDLDLTALEKCFNIHYRKYYYRNRAELTQLIFNLKKNGYTKVICNYIGCSIARAEGLEAFYFYSQKCIEDGIRNVLQLLRELEQENSYISKVKSILENTTCGVVYALADTGRISYVNKTALDILHLSKENLIQKPFESLVPAMILSQITEQRKPENNIQLSIFGTDIIGNIIPLQIQKGSLAICLLFEKASRILDAEVMIRKKIRRKNFSAHYFFNQIIGKSISLQKSIRKAKLFADSDFTILINAETGVGKEVFAQSIHNYSKRNEFPFVAINCSAIPDTLIESELFGYEAGAFTGASSKGKRGLLELANHGTVFLDDIDTLSQSFQPKLLRAMQEREIVRVGGNSLIPIDVRFIVASNQNLKKKVLEGSFRNDLYYRINVLRLNLSPLRDRPEDIPLLYEYYLNKFNDKLFQHIKPNFNECFRPVFRYAHPGNTRELISIVERFLALMDPSLADNKQAIAEVLADCIEEDIAEDPLDNSCKVSLSGNYRTDVLAAESTILEHYLKTNTGTINDLAQHLGISRATLYNKLRGIER